MSSEIRTDYDRKFHFKSVSMYVYNVYYLEFTIAVSEPNTEEKKQIITETE